MKLREYSPLRRDALHIKGFVYDFFGLGVFSGTFEGMTFAIPFPHFSYLLCNYTIKVHGVIQGELAHPLTILPHTHTITPREIKGVFCRNLRPKTT